MAMNYHETLAFMYKQLPMYQRIGVSAFKKDLKNIMALMECLGNPHEDFKSIHIAGTNGKGSVSHLIAASLQSNNYKVGLYTSPHYLDFRERIKINGAFISKREVVQFVEKIKPHLKTIQPSFFEITVAMAFTHFATEKVDFAIIETGLGGRLDSTNIVNPILSVITNISMDHMSMLGNTLEEIAGEKAGIIKKNTPVLIGEKQEEVAPIFKKKATQKDSKLSYAKEWVEVKDNKVFIHESNQQLKILGIERESPFMALNLRTALASLCVLENEGLILDWDKVSQMLPSFGQAVKYIGRWQWLSQNPDILLDSAHNEAGIKMLVKGISKLGYVRIHFVLGVSSDKDLNSVLPYFPIEGKFYFAKADVPRGMEALHLQSKAETFGIYGKAYSSVRKALAAAKKSSKSQDLIVVCGSIFTVAEVVVYPENNNQKG